MADKTDGTDVHFPPQNPPPYSTGPLPQDPMVGVTVVQPMLPGTTMVGATGPVFVMGPNLGPKPQTFNCTHCHSSIVTRVNLNRSMRTHLVAALLCLLGCWPCVCIPYCMEACNNIDHYCPHCGVFIGTYKH